MDPLPFRPPRTPNRGARATSTTRHKARRCCANVLDCGGACGSLVRSGAWPLHFNRRSYREQGHMSPVADGDSISISFLLHVFAPMCIIPQFEYSLWICSKESVLAWMNPQPITPRDTLFP